jgi:hypothetical protein
MSGSTHPWVLPVTHSCNYLKERYITIRVTSGTVFPKVKLVHEKHKGWKLTEPKSARNYIVLINVASEFNSS